MNIWLIWVSFFQSIPYRLSVEKKNISDEGLELTDEELDAALTLAKAKPEKLDLDALDQVAGGVDTEEIMAKIGSTFGTVTVNLVGAKEKLGRVADLFSATINGYATAAMGNPLGALGETCREMGVISKGIDTIKASQGAIRKKKEDCNLQSSFCSVHAFGLTERITTVK